MPFKIWIITVPHRARRFVEHAMQKKRKRIDAGRLSSKNARRPGPPGVDCRGTPGTPVPLQRAVRELVSSLTNRILNRQHEVTHSIRLPSSSDMPYSLCVLGKLLPWRDAVNRSGKLADLEVCPNAHLGCGTMGVAIISGVIESLKKPAVSQQSSSVPQSPLADSDPDIRALPEDSIPDRFITCVSRSESGRKLKKRWSELGREDIDVRVSDNVRAVAESDVILLGYVFGSCQPSSLALLT
jgi:hypothetical protein